MNSKRAFKPSLISLATLGAFSQAYPIGNNQRIGALLMSGNTTPRAKQPFYSLKSEVTERGRVVELQIYGEIGFWGITAKEFIDELHAVADGAVEVIVAVNSPGGDVFDAFAIYNALRRYAGKVTARVDAIAASAASLIVMAGDTVVMPENAMLMIHNPWTFVMGTAEELRKTAEMMDKARDGIVAAYRNKSGQDDAALIKMMDEETWLSALEAQALGFADVIEEPVKLAASIRTGELLAKFSKAPTALLDVLVIEDVPPAVAAPLPAPIADKLPGPAPAPPPASPNASTLAAQVFRACRTDGISHLAESVLLTCGLHDAAQVDTRIAAAKEIASLALAAKLPEMAVSLVAAGLDVEQARARLFDAVTTGAADDINNRLRPESGAQPINVGPSAAGIYAARKSAQSPNHGSRRN